MYSGSSRAAVLVNSAVAGNGQLRGAAARRLTGLAALLGLALVFLVFAARPTLAQGSGALINSPAQAAELLDIARQENAKLKDDPKAKALDLQLKATWKRRIALLEEYLTQAQAQQQLSEQLNSLPEQLVEARRQLDAMNAAPAVIAGGSLDTAAYEAMDDQLQQARDRLSQLLGQQSAQRQVEDNQSSRIEAAQLRIETADQRLQLLTQTESPASEAERRIVELQLENARLDKQVAEQSIALYKAEHNWQRESEPLQRLQQDLAEQQISVLERQLDAYNQSLQQSLDTQSAQAEQALMQKEQDAQTAATPEQRFIARWEALIARSQKNQRELQGQLINLKKDESEQDKRLATEKDEFLAIRDLISTSDIAGATAERIKQTLQQVRQRRVLLTRILRNGGVQALNQYRSSRFAIEDRLFGLAASFEKERAEVSSQVSESARSRFLSQTDSLLATYRNALRDEKALLTELISLGQSMQLLAGQRLETLNELQRFIRSRAFWLRDTKPLGPQALSPLPGELKKAVLWLANLTSPQIRTRLAEVMTTPATLISALLLFPLLPLGLYYARRRIRAISRGINDRVVAEGKLLHLGALVIVTGLLSAALLPLYFYIIARLLNNAQLPAGIGAVGFRLFDHLALFLFLWFLTRSFFARRSITEVQFDLPRPAANAFYAAIRWFLFGYLVWLLPRDLFSQVPFEFEALPRVLYTLFLITVTVGVYRLVRVGSPFVEHQLQQLDVAFISQHWKTIAVLINAIAVAALALDISGHRYASESIVISLGGSLAVLVSLPPVYRRILAALNAFLNRHRRTAVGSLDAESSWVAETTTSAMPDTAVAGTGRAADAVSADTPSPAASAGETAQSATDVDSGQPVIDAAETGRLQRVLRLLFFLLGAISLLNLWGIDEQALRTLDDMHLYTVRITGAEAEFVSAGDLLRCLLFLIVTFWILRVLPGIYEVALFPRLRLDAGVKYATLTISRYTVFVVGFFFALAELHLDLGRLGWLMAAIGVGLGFGLQEIVSNFVSGLILLIERPVRPGDTVTIGTLSGKVERINIRATTIVNFDRQEVMVPNRTLITSNVTNWTRSDTVNRLVIPIGVAYGSDVERVGELLLAIATEQPEVMRDPAPSVVFMAHGESSLDFSLRVFVPSPGEIMLLRDRLNRLINKAFAAEGIEIPFPQRDLHIRSNDLARLKDLEPGTTISAGTPT